MKAWICALAILLACTEPTSSRAYISQYVPPQPPAERYQVSKTVEVIATKYFIPKREDYSSYEQYLKAVRLNGGKITKTGKSLRLGHIAANLKRFKLGTVIRIKETGLIGIIEDTGAAMRRNPNQIDIFSLSKEDAEEWGRRKVTMEILEPAKG